MVGSVLRGAAGTVASTTASATSVVATTVKGTALFAGGLAIGGVALAVESVVGATRTAVNATLDTVVPVVVDAIVERVDLTQLVVDHVDVDAVVAQASIEPIVERVPMVTIADYLIDEIDLPQIIRESTGGIAVDTVHAARLRAMAADALIGRISDSVLFKRRRDTASPLATEPPPGPVTSSEPS